MQKLLSTLLTIIFFQTSIFAFPVSFVAQIVGQYDNDSVLRTGLHSTYNPINL